MQIHRSKEAEMKTMRTAAALVAAIAAMAVLAAGCGDDSEEDASGAVSGASAETGPGVEYSECMRENGVPEFPDPVDGQLRIQATPGSGLDPNSPEWQQAQEACQDLAPAGAQAGGSPDPAVEAQVLEYAECMRENGVPDFPDPDVSGGGVRMQLPPGIDPNSTQFQAAQDACSEIMSELGGAP